MSRKEARATPLDRPPPLRPRVGCALHRNLNPLPQEDLRCCMVRVNTTSSCKSCRIQGQTRSYRPATAPTHLLQQSSRHEHQRSIHVLGAGMVINVNVQAQLKPKHAKATSTSRKDQDRLSPCLFKQHIEPGSLRLQNLRSLPTLECTHHQTALLFNTTAASRSPTHALELLARVILQVPVHLSQSPS